MNPVYLKDYTPPTYSSPQVDLIFDIYDHETIVRSIQKIEGAAGGELVLNGEHLRLMEVKIDGRVLAQNEYELEAHQLVIKKVPKAFKLEITNSIDPKKNTTCEGLYFAQGLYCTQNEPQGMRRITYFIDRPDNMVSFTTRITAVKKDYPILLSNGDLLEEGDLTDGRHYAFWRDPFKKPSYLFALVAGKLGMIRDSFTTMKNRVIDLRIYCDPGNERQCHFAMESLKKAMRWDEERFGLEYDLDTFMIVAVDSFNMGAMENKGLNIFNSNVLYAHADTATDDDYWWVEGVVGHEYFHNWTGNRVTCRDWFQLTLKEGLTVFRDQEFSGDMSSRDLKRIIDVERLMRLQFPEDSGPSAHPIKPKFYIEMNNFYTATVYEKGAEVIRMLQTMLGEKVFRAGMDEYFRRYDGMAVTTENFVSAMEAASSRDFTQFRESWYNRKGTPRLQYAVEQDLATGKMVLHLEVKDPYSEENKIFPPHQFPLLVGAIGKSSKKDLKLSPELLEVTKTRQSFTFSEVYEEVVLSLNRNFSAPVLLSPSMALEDLAFLAQFDSDGFNRWYAMREMSVLAIKEIMQKKTLNPLYMKTFRAILEDEQMDGATMAYVLTLPGTKELLETQFVMDFQGTHEAREFLLQEIGSELKELFAKKYQQLEKEQRGRGGYQFDHDGVALRKVKNLCLFYLMRGAKKHGDKQVVAWCVQQYRQSDNMTDTMEALSAINQWDSEEREELMQDFYQKWKHNNNVILKWLGLQGSCHFGDVLARVKKVTKDPAFDLLIPNKVRQLFRAFTGNFTAFHHPSGESYRFVADTILQLDSKNPHIAAGLADAFSKMSRVSPNLRELMRKEVERMLKANGLSNNTFEILSNIAKSC